jgi:hypothetical protein
MPQARKTTSRTTDPLGPVYQLRIELLHIQPPIWRRILVPASIKLPKLHFVLLCAMGWNGGHLHEFAFGGTRYGEQDPDFMDDPSMRDQADAALNKALGTLKSFTYVYDFGDDWQHRVKVEKILPPSTESRLPLCVAGSNACPPEDVGGPPGYAQFLEAINDPSHEDHQEMLEWWGGRYDAEEFDLDAVNEMLSGIKL